MKIFKCDDLCIVSYGRNFGQDWVENVAMTTIFFRYFAIFSGKTFHMHLTSSLKLRLLLNEGRSLVAFMKFSQKCCHGNHFIFCVHFQFFNSLQTKVLGIFS